MEYISRVRLELNGQVIEDFKQVEEGDVEIAKEVDLMNKTGSVGVTERRKITVDYVIPKNAPEFNFASVIEGTLTLDKENGTRDQFIGVRTLTIGAATYDGEKEAIRKITFLATDKV